MNRLLSHRRGRVSRRSRSTTQSRKSVLSSRLLDRVDQGRPMIRNRSGRGMLMDDLMDQLELVDHRRCEDEWVGFWLSHALVETV